MAVVVIVVMVRVVVVVVVMATVVGVVVGVVPVIADKVHRSSPSSQCPQSPITDGRRRH